MKSLVETAIFVFLVLLFLYACVGASITIARTATNSKDTKQALNLCSAESIQIGEDVEWIYVKVKK